METILNFEDVSYHYLDGSSNVSILNKANYSFEKGKIYAIVGASGSGKTTTIVLAGGLDKPKGGKVIFKGQDTARIGLNKYRRNDISIVFQSYNLIHYMNAYENVANAIEIAGRKIPNKKEYCLDILKKLGLSKEQSLRDIRKLSGGQQQRVAIARALVSEAPIILADEPTGNLDESTALEIIEMLNKLAKSRNKCVIVVTHSKEVAKAADYILEIKNKNLKEVNFKKNS